MATPAQPNGIRIPAPEVPPGPPPPTRTHAPPPGWGSDELSKFLHQAHQNQYATFVRKREAIAKLIALDAEFAKVSKGWLNPPSEIQAMLFLRCHAAYRTAAGLAMSGQAAETFVQCRATLEYAAYAVHLHCDPSLGEVWLNRHQGAAEMKAQKDAFSHRKVDDRGARPTGPCSRSCSMGTASRSIML